jgi:hypothetical protein
VREDVAVFSTAFESAAVGVVLSVVVRTGMAGRLAGLGRIRDNRDEEQNGSESNLHGWIDQVPRILLDQERY